jgi:hypothetical protein
MRLARLLLVALALGLGIGAGALVAARLAPARRGARRR